MDFTPRALIDHSALRNNLQRVREAAPGSRVWAVIKANAYGHGLLPVAETLSGADGMAVARVEEAVRLREAGLEMPLLVLEGPMSGEAFRAAAKHRLEVVLHQEDQLRLLDSGGLAPALRVWIKVDSGMHRLGFHPAELPAVKERVERSAACRGPVRWLTHLANADDLVDPKTDLQTTLTRASVPSTGELSIANSGGVLGWPRTHADWVRPGIMLYGVSPFTGEVGEQRNLRPVMTLEARLISTRKLRRGDPVGYGGAFICPETMSVGAVGIGYGDGYPRHAPTGTPVLLNGRRVPLLGRVSMDILTIDLRTQADARIGDPVVLWGDGLPVEEIAAAAGTIGYELLCGINERVRVLHRNRKQEPRE